jgi:high-affinity iron transporter
MFETAIVVFREMLEAAIIIGIIAAATKSIPNRNKWLTFSILLGLLGAVMVAYFGRELSGLAEGMGQELFNASVMGLVVVMLAWQTIWMSAHGAELSNSAKEVGRAIRDGRKELSVLLIIVGVAILREGSEVVVFLYGLSASGTGSYSMLIGGVIGILVGAIVGYIIYTGLLRLPIRLFFKAMTILISFLAAGLASQAAHYLVQANLLPSLATPLWDLSWLLSNQSLLGSFLQTLMGYDARPDGIQVVFYFTTLAIIFLTIKIPQYVHERDVRQEI